MSSICSSRVTFLFWQPVFPKLTLYLLASGCAALMHPKQISLKGYPHSSISSDCYSLSLRLSRITRTFCFRHLHGCQSASRYLLDMFVCPTVEFTEVNKDSHNPWCLARNPFSPALWQNLNLTLSRSSCMKHLCYPAFPRTGGTGIISRNKCLGCCGCHNCRGKQHNSQLENFKEKKKYFSLKKTLFLVFSLFLWTSLQWL